MSNGTGNNIKLFVANNKRIFKLLTFGPVRK
jgi:hypothetical protein